MKIMEVARVFVSSLINNPKTLNTKTVLRKKVKEKFPKLTYKQIDELLSFSSNEAISLAAKGRKKTRIPWVSKSGTWQMDLVFIDDHPILTAVNVNSRFAFAKLLPNKKGPSVVKALRSFLDSYPIVEEGWDPKQTGAIIQTFERDNIPRFIRTIQCDKGSEFTQKEFKKAIGDAGVELQYLDKTTKAFHVERFHKTLREKIQMYKEVSGHFKKWMTAFDDLVENYNTTPIRLLRSQVYQFKKGKGHTLAPSDITIDQEITISMNTLGEAIMKAGDQQKLEIGDIVRMKLKKETFGKTGRKWSKQVFEVVGKEGFSVVLSNAVTGGLSRVNPDEVLRTGAGGAEGRRGVSGPKGTAGPESEEDMEDVEEVKKKETRSKKRTQLLLREGMSDSNIRPTRTRSRTTSKSSS